MFLFNCKLGFCNNNLLKNMVNLLNLWGLKISLRKEKQKNEVEKITVMNGWEVSNVEALHSKPIQDKEPNMT